MTRTHEENAQDPQDEEGQSQDQAQLSVLRYFMATALVIYKIPNQALNEPDRTASRYMNSLLTTSNSFITRADLAELQRSLIQRMTDEAHVVVDNIKDVVFLNISSLGDMDEATFQNGPENPSSSSRPN